MLRGLRVPAAVRDATAAWSNGQEAVVAIPVTDDGRVLTLDADDAIAMTLTVRALLAAFREAGLTLWLDAGDDVGDDVGDDEAELADASDEFGADAETPAGADAEIDPALFAPAVVQVASFSHRGPGMARVAAQLQQSEVEHVESGVWSLQRFSTAEPSGAGSASGADLPVIELSRTEIGDGWFDVRLPSGVVPFWTDAERDAQPVLDIDAITVPETAAIVHRLLTEGDGSRDDLLEVASRTPLDVDAAHAALIPEALGGVVGAEARQRAFLAAFGVPAELIDAAFGEPGALEVRRFVPTGWWALVRELLIEGAGGLTPLTRRGCPTARFGRMLRERPLRGVALSTAELTAGLALSRLRGVGRVLGILLVVDAVVDLLIWAVRLRRVR
ncbi:hypothetical protein GCM10027408_32240 [Microbacterium tumbae]